MATQNYFTNFTQSVGSALGSGVQTLEFQTTIAILAADDNGSTYLIYKDFPQDGMLVSLEIERDAITGGTDYDIGFYNAKTGVVIDADTYLNGGDFSATATTKVAPMDGLAMLTHSGNLVKAWEVLSGETQNTADGRYDLVLTANTVGSGAGSVTFRGKIMFG